MSLYPAPPPPQPGYYDHRIYSRYTGDIYAPTTTLLAAANAADEKTVVGDWSTAMTGSGLGFSTSGPYGMMMTSPYEQFARNVFPPEMEMSAGTHGIEFVSAGGRLLVGASAPLKPEPEVVGEAEDQLRRNSSGDNSTGSEMITAAAADTSGDDVIREKLNDGSTGNEVEAAGHVFAPDSDQHHGHERQCLLWACKTCKKRSAAAVDRRKVYSLAFSVLIFSARCNIYISRLCYDVSVRLSVCL